jgi:PST family polysaccharide transporter
VTLPYLARILSPKHWGLVAFAQSFGLYAALVVEFGFMLSATREVARHRTDSRKLGEIFASVVGAKAILAACCLVIATVIVTFLPTFQGHRIMMYSGVLAGIAQGYNVAWFYQGIERMRVVSAIDISSKALFSVSIFLFIHSPKDDWAVLCIQCFWYCAATVLLTLRVYREYPIARLTLRTAISAIKSSSSMFLYRGSLTLYTTANTLILGFLSTPFSVAYYSAAEKINNVLLNSGTPVSQAIYPKMNYLATHDPNAAARIARTTLQAAFILGWLLCLASILSAPLVVRILFGSGYEPVVPVLRILGLALPSVTCSIVLGVQCMLPLGMDKEFNLITILAGIFNVAAALFLVPRYAHIGMAWSLVMTEFLVVLCQFSVLVRKAPHFFYGKTALPSEGEAL